MMVTVQRTLRQLSLWGRLWLARPGIRGCLGAAGWAGGGLLLSAASLRGLPQPIALGLVVSLSDWKAMAACLGALLGYRLFWGAAARRCLWWSVGAGLLALMAVPKKLLPVLTAFLVALTGLLYRLTQEDTTPLGLYMLSVGVAWGAGWVFLQRSRVSRWLRCCAAALALAQIGTVSGISLGPGLLGMLAVSASFPAAALAGLGLDLARITKLPMTAVACLAWLLRLLNIKGKIRGLFPALAGVAAMVCMGIRDLRILPALALGGAVGLFLPATPDSWPQPGATGITQVRLEMASGVLAEFQKRYLTLPPPVIDREALLQRLRSRVCGNCSLRGSCLEQTRLTATVLEDTHSFPCRKPGRLKGELSRTREQLRLIKADHRRREEYRSAMVQQYRFLSDYLQTLSDRLSQREEGGSQIFGVTVCVRTRGRKCANGDRWAAFPGGTNRYYVALCDGMGTGEPAKQQSSSALQLLRKLLGAQVSPEQALRSINSMLTLTGQAGAVTFDLAELRLDTGQVRIFKWGGAPSWRVSRGKAEKIGTAGPPPGLSVKTREAMFRLSLRRGEMLILISDGVDGEEVPRRVHIAPDAPPGELAEKLLEGVSGEVCDDATAAVIRLYPRNLATS